MEQNSALAANTNDVDSVLGTWVNSNEKTQWIEKFTLLQKNDKLLLHIYSSQSPQDWGETEVNLFINRNSGDKAFWAKYNLGSVEALLAANTNQGLWIIAAFLQFKDTKQPNFLCREFYYRVG
ncbi:hypothetical protein [Gloeothece verrucosa]|uniref:Uncharacterized protein n=1 Tax=Gloeothece verrucosa (strain PCC 7822) TaxID=497965 RepID=E0UKY3_GLOV7|nr:hypothetical protein [Gloeothece verrucosa]ADN17613.1 hypothetical protein Cyan7822_5752 [Gloeothece verrucosa PCC 7822]